MDNSAKHTISVCTGGLQLTWSAAQRARWVIATSLLAIFTALSVPVLAEESFPAVGDMAADFELQTVAGEPVKLSKLLEKGPVVLVVLRGYPGYQCPACQAQVGQFVARAEPLRAAGAQVVFVYPGPEAELTLKAQEFLGSTKLPQHFQMVLDPDYTFTNAYRLRWNAIRETAYPATFVIQPGFKITFANVSRTHGGRVKPDEVLKAIAEQK